MQLKISHIRAQIGINRNDAVLSIRQPKADLQIQTTPGEFDIKTEQVKVKIDQKQCFSEAGLKDVFELTEDFANLGKEAALEAIGRIVSEGNQLAMIENKSNAIKEIAATKALPDAPEFNITFIPKSRPKIEVVGGTMTGGYQKGNVDVKITANAPEFDYKPGNVEIYLLQKPEFQIEFVGNNVDISK